MEPDGLLDHFQSAWSGRVRNAFSEVCAVDVHYEDPLVSRPLVGLDELADHAAQLWEAAPNAQVHRAGERLTDGQFVAAPFRLSGRHSGTLPRLPASGKQIDLHGVLYCELDAARERLWRVRAFFDPYEAGIQLGVFPRHGTLGERALLMLRGFGLRD